MSDVQYNVQGQMIYFNRSSASAKDSIFAYADQTGNFRLMGIQHGSLTDEVPDYSYSYDPAGNITQITEQLQQGGVNRSLVQTFGYDKLSRLLMAQSLGNSNLGVLSYNHIYRYDKLGNMTQWQNNGVLTTYGYTSGRPHAVSSTSGGVNATFGYDPQGNMNNRTQNGVSYVQGFDKENRLTSVTTNGQTTHFKYDANGQRTMTLAPSGLYTFYPFPNVEEEVNLNNQDYTLKYTYSSAGVAVGVRTKAKQGTTTTNTLHYLYSDHLGSTSTVTNSSGGQVQQTRFLPFGGYWGTPTQTVTDRGYTGHLHNDEVGLIYMNARFYVPSIGRFASADTIVPNPTNPQAFNRYSYVKNNPLNRVDPTGHVDCGMLGDESDSAGCETAKSIAIQKEIEKVIASRKEFSEQELDYIIIGIFSDSSHGKYSDEVLSLLAWLFFNREKPGDVFSGIDTSNKGNTCAKSGDTECGSWWGLIGSGYGAMTSQERELAIKQQIINRQGDDDYQRVADIVKNAYAQYRAGAADPTYGSTEFSVQSPYNRDIGGGETYSFPNVEALHSWLTTNFAEFAQENDGFRYVISQPFNAISGPVVAVFGTGGPNSGCVNDGSCGWP